MKSCKEPTTKPWRWLGGVGETSRCPWESAKWQETQGDWDEAVQKLSRDTLIESLPPALLCKKGEQTSGFIMISFSRGRTGGSSNSKKPSLSARYQATHVVCTFSCKPETPMWGIYYSYLHLAHKEKAESCRRSHNWIARVWPLFKFKYL